MRSLTPAEWLDEIETHAEDAGDGEWLEQLVCDLGPSIPEWDLHAVFPWSEWPDKEKYFPLADSVDRGIDSVGIRSDGALVAIQCKARSRGSRLTPKELGTFATSTLDEKWIERWVVSNVDFHKGSEHGKGTIYWVSIATVRCRGTCPYMVIQKGHRDALSCSRPHTELRFLVLRQVIA